MKNRKFAHAKITIMVILRIALLIGIIVGIELLFFWALRLLFLHKKSAYQILKKWNMFLIFSFIIFCIVYSWYLFSLSIEYERYRGFFLIFGLFYLIYFPKLLMGLAALLYGVQYLFFGLLKWPLTEETGIKHGIGLIQKQRFIVFLSLVIALFMMGLIAYGMIWGKYQYRLEHVNIVSERVPAAFHGLKIIHITDTHLGSLANPAKIEKAINIINSTKPDLILFTGDMVNDQAVEAIPFISYFKKIKSTYGGYSVLGNHDMGDYRRWYDDKAKQYNLQLLDSVQQAMGFRLLRNENTIIRKDNQSIIIAGVDNWGLPPFRQYGDLNKTLKNVDSNACIILLSHDPSHWTAEVLPKTSVFLTLSGHTHGMQMGLKIGKWIWSPVKYIYPHYAGLFQNDNQYLYVNRGLGFIGYPGRFGMLPEITLITLQTK